MTDFPNGVSSPGAPNYAAPLLDFGPLGQLGNDYYKGQDDQRKQRSANAFRNGIPKTAEGTNDYKAMTDKMIEYGDFGTATAVSNLGVSQQQLDLMRNDPIMGPGKPAAPASPASPARAPQRQSSVPQDETPARPDNNGGFTPPPKRQASSAPTTPPDNNDSDNGGAGDQITPAQGKAFKSRLDAMEPGQRQDYLLRVMSNYPKQWAEAARVMMEHYNKQRELTPGQKELQDGTTAAAADIKVKADNRTLTGTQKEAGIGFGGPVSTTQAVEDIKVDGANRTLTPTAKDNTPLPGETPAQAAKRTEVRGALDTEAGKKSIDAFSKEYTGLQAAGQMAYNGIEKAKLGAQLTLQPTFYSGPLQPTAQLYQQFRATFGSNPSSAVPQEAFQKVVTDMLTEQVKALGQSGVGRVLQVEVQNMQKSIASLGITPATNRVLLETIQRVYGQSQELAKISQDIQGNSAIPPEQKQLALDRAAKEYFQKTPLFNTAEKSDPRLIGAPRMPAGVNSREAVMLWAKATGIPPGDPVRNSDGSIGLVPRSAAPPAPAGP